MKKIFFKIVILSFVFMYVSGCSDFLDKEVLGLSTEENFYDTRYKLQAALNATYDVLQTGTFMECDWRFGEATADNVIGGDEGLGSQMGQLVNFRFTTSNAWIEARYSINYIGIHRANLVIANAHRVKIADNEYVTYRAIREILAQAKFLRAFFYFNLVKTFGGVPIRPETETVDNLVIPRSTAEEVYAYIEKDLREAAIMLPAKFIEGNAGKADEGACVSLLMKVIMYQTTPGERSEKWEELVHIGDFFIDGKLMTYGEILKFEQYKEEWEDLRKRLWFKPQELMTKEEMESIEKPEKLLPSLNTTYSLEYVNNIGMSLNYGYLGQFYGEGEFCRGSVFEVVFKESADGTAGDANDGSHVYDDLFVTHLGYCPMHATQAMVNDLFQGDPRYGTIITHQQYTPDGETIQCGPTRYIPLKWFTPIKERPQYWGDNGKNRRVIRFVEVVLMYAEALNECNEGARALEQLNKCKAQANKMGTITTLYNAGGYGYMRDQIWKERRIELAYEWDRFFDLVRQKRAAEIIQSFGSTLISTRGYYFRKGVNEIFPIPQREIDISNGVVEQNPGY